MINMRIDIIRKELDRRFEEVIKLKDNDHNKVEDAVADFLYCLLSEPATKDFVLDLSRFDEDYLKSKEYKPVEKQAVESIKVIISEIDKSGFVNDEFKKEFMGKYKGLGNPFNLSDPDIGNEFLSIGMYLEGLRNIEKHPDCIINNLKSIIGVVFDIFEIADNKANSYDRNKIRDYLDQLRDCIFKLEAYLIHKAEYNGTSALHRLIPQAKFLLAYNFVLGNIYNDLGKEIMDRMPSNKYNSPSDSLVGDCETLYHAVDKFLMTSKSKSALIDKLITYCMWFKRKDFPKSKARTKYKNEEKISAILEKFIFNQGYFPVVNFKMGRSKPDILAEPTLPLSWDNSVLIELKQYIGKSYSESQFKSDVGQACDYLSIVKGAKPDIVDVVYLLVFYDGDKRLILDKSFSEDNVQVEFIYVGKLNPSTLKKRKILGKN